MIRTTKIAVRRVQTGDRQDESIQRPSRDVVGALNAFPFVKGRLFSVTFAASTAKTISHGLGVPAACMIVRQNYDGTGNVPRLGESSTATQAKLDLNNQLSLVCDLACMLDLWFYPAASVFIDPATGIGG